MRWRKVGEATAEEGSRYQVHRSLSYGEEVPEFRPGAGAKKRSSMGHYREQLIGQS